MSNKVFDAVQSIVRGVTFNNHPSESIPLLKKPWSDSGGRPASFSKTVVTEAISVKSVAVSERISKQDPYWLLLKGIAATYGSLLYWVGAWNLLSGYRKSLEGIVCHHLPTVNCDLTYLILGIFLTLTTDTFYSSAGLPGGLWSQNWCGTANMMMVTWRCTVALIAHPLLWTGIYNCLDTHMYLTCDCGDSDVCRCYWKDIVGCLFGGVLILFGTNTFANMAMIYPSDIQHDHSEDPTQNSPIQVHLKYALRTLLSLVGQNLIWLGFYRVLELYSESTMWRELFWISFGLLLMLSTDSFWANTMLPDVYLYEMAPETKSMSKATREETTKEVDTSDAMRERSVRFWDEQPTEDTQEEFAEPDETSQDGTWNFMPPKNEQDEHFGMVVGNSLNFSAAPLSFIMLTLGAISGQVTHMYGTWTIMDSYVHRTVGRDVVYLLSGIILMSLSGTLLSNAGLTPVFFNDLPILGGDAIEPVVLAVEVLDFPPHIRGSSAGIVADEAAAEAARNIEDDTIEPRTGSGATSSDKMDERLPGPRCSPYRRYS